MFRNNLLRIADVYALKWFRENFLIIASCTVLWLLFDEPMAITGCILIFIGRGLNEIAWCLNNNKMPIRTPPQRFIQNFYLSEKHCFITESTRVKCLCDIIPYIWLRNTTLVLKYASVGDIVQLLGSVLLFCALLRFVFFSCSWALSSFLQ